MEKKFRQSGKEKPHGVARKRKYFRRRKINSLSGFHLFFGFAQLLLSQTPSSLRSRLNTFGLPSGSVFVWRAIRITARAIQLRWMRSKKACGCILFVIKKFTSASHQVVLFRRHTNNPPRKALAVRALNYQAPERS